MAKKNSKRPQGFNSPSSPKPKSTKKNKQAKALFNKGNNAGTQGKFTEAILAYDAALVIKPDYHEALTHKGNALAHLERYDDALQCCNAALAIKPNNHRALFLKGLCLNSLGHYEDAIRTYDAALAINSNYYEVLCNKGNSLNNLGRYEDAIRASDTALDIKPDLCEALLNKGVSLENLGRYEDAIHAYDAALAIRPDLYTALNEKGNLLHDLGLYENAIQVWEEALAIKPDYYIALFNKGNSLNSLNRYEDAICAYDAVLAIKPSDHKAFWNKGVSLNKLGYYEDAICAFDAALALNPNEHNILLNKGNSLANLGCYEDALCAYEAALAIKSNYYEALDSKGNCLAKLGRHEDALCAYEAALDVKPNDHVILTHKGLSLANLGRNEDAIRACNAALSNKPDYHVAWFQRASSICSFGKYIPTPKNLISHFQTPVFSAKQFAEPHIIALEESLKFLTQGSIDWGYMHLHLGETYLRHSKLQQNPIPYWREARRSYQTAANILTLENFAEDHLKILQGFVFVELAFENIPDARDYQNQGRRLFEQLRAQKPDKLKPAFEREFASFVQLEIDLLISENHPIAALEQAEFYKNRCLTWILDSWTDTLQSPNFQDIQTLLKPQTALIYWHLSHESLTTFILLPQQEVPIVITANRTKQAQQLMSWLGTYTSEYRSYAWKKAGSEQRPKHPWRLHLKSLLEQLKKILSIEAICNELSENISELILIPHRDLHRLPLHTLFPENLTTTYLPSAQIGLTLLSISNSLTPLLNVNDPDTEQPAMPYARVESDLVRNLVGNATHLTDTITTTDATNALQSHYTTLHFTGHGEYNHRQPENSALQLSDGVLTAKHISTLDLSGYGLVCLASCETALTGTDTITTEYVGLVSAFLKAGATNVLSTLWQVEEIASTWLIVRFYQALLEDQPPAKALHIAQHWLRTLTAADLANWITHLRQTPGISNGTVDVLNSYAAVILEDHADSLNQPLYNDPFFWAGFTLTGKG